MIYLGGFLRELINGFFGVLKREINRFLICG
jgi:hypothetical protein